jgi:hypothetical protein
VHSQQLEARPSRSNTGSCHAGERALGGGAWEGGSTRSCAALLPSPAACGGEAAAAPGCSRGPSPAPVCPSPPRAWGSGRAKARRPGRPAGGLKPLRSCLLAAGAKCIAPGAARGGGGSSPLPCCACGNAGAAAAVEAVQAAHTRTAAVLLLGGARAGWEGRAAGQTGHNGRGGDSALEGAPTPPSAGPRCWSAEV